MILTFCNCHYDSRSTKFVCLWHSVPVIMKLLPQLSVILMFCNFHYEVPSKALCATDILYLSLGSYYQWFLCYWHSVPFFMKLLPQPCVLITFSTCRYEAHSTAFCATDIRCMSKWSSFHLSLCYCHSVPVIMKLIPHLCVFLIFCNCHYETPCTTLSAIDLLYLSLWNSIYSPVYYWYSVPLIMKLIPQLCL